MMRMRKAELDPIRSALPIQAQVRRRPGGLLSPAFSPGSAGGEREKTGRDRLVLPVFCRSWYENRLRLFPVPEGWP